MCISGVSGLIDAVKRGEKARIGIFGSVYLRLGVSGGRESSLSGSLSGESWTFFEIFVRKLLLHERYL